MNTEYNDKNLLKINRCISKWLFILPKLLIKCCNECKLNHCVKNIYYDKKSTIGTWEIMCFNDIPSAPKKMLFPPPPVMPPPHPPPPVMPPPPPPPLYTPIHPEKNNILLNSLPPGLTINDISLPPGLTINDISLPPGLTINDISLPPGLTINDISLPPGLTINDISLSPGLTINDISLPPELTINDISLPPGLPLPQGLTFYPRLTNNIN